MGQLEGKACLAEGDGCDTCLSALALGEGEKKQEKNLSLRIPTKTHTQAGLSPELRATLAENLV